MLSFFKSHYEKIILASLLVIFVFLLVWQVNFLQAGQSKNVDDIINKVEPKSDQTKYDFFQEKFESSFIFLDQVVWHQKPKVNELPHPTTDLFSCFNLSVCPFCYNLIPMAYFPEEGSSEVSSCPVCKGKLAARQKKAEGNEQEINLTTVAANNDKNNNSVPDDWEKANDVYVENNAAIVDEDPDGDGFTTYEEFVLKTNPKDPKSHPPYIAYTSVMQLERRPIPDFAYQGLPSPGETDLKKLDLSVRYRDPDWRKPRTKTKKLGQTFRHAADKDNKVVWTFEIVKVVPDDPQSPGQGTVIYVRRKGFNEEIKCERRKEVYDPVETVDFWCAPYNRIHSRKKISCQVGGTLRLGDAKTGEEEYTLVSATSDSAVAVNSKGEKFELKKYVPGQTIVEKRASAGGNPEGSAHGVSSSGRDKDLPPPLEGSSGSKRQR